MKNQGCSEGNIQETATRLFQAAALLMGNETEAVTLVEEALAGVEIDPCADGERAQVVVESSLVQSAIQRLSQREPNSFVAAAGSQSVGACIEGDDLTAAGISHEQLATLLESGERSQLRNWLEHLPAAQRTIFVERAMLGRGNEATAESLRTGGGSAASGWTSDKVSEVFRQALCSLTNSLLHANAVQLA